MNDNNECILKQITDFLIKVGEHCLECEQKTPIVKTIEPTNQTNKSRNIKLSYIEKWIRQNEYMEVFTLDQFYKDYPKQKENNRLTNNISKLISENKLLQLGKNKFKIIR